MAKIYVPTDYLDKECYQVFDGYIRVWETIDDSSDNNVYDIFLNQDYQVQHQQLLFDNTIQCDYENIYTDDFYYRIDLSQILIIFTIFCIFGIWIPIKIFLRLFRRFN